MKLRTWLLRRHASRWAFVLSLMVPSSLVVATSLVGATLVSTAGPSLAAADPLSDARARAAALAQRIQALGYQEEALSESYDEATLALQQAQLRVDAANEQLAADERAESAARVSLANEAVDAYVNGGDETAQATRNAPPLSSADQNLIRVEYLGDLTSDQDDVIDQYHLASLKTADDRTQLRAALGAAQRQQAALAHDRQAVASAAAALQNTLNSVNGQIATLVAQAQAAQQRAAALQEQQRLAAQRQAAAQAAQARQAAAIQPTSGLTGDSAGSGAFGTTTPAGPSSAVPVVATGSLQAKAVAYALSRVGDPYVWGAAGPDAFDCSGLVMWSYEQAGYSLPHFSGAQYADTIHIPLADVEPGDLVFPADPAQHVAMYIGGGNIVQAPYSGADVQVIPLTNFFVYASRVP